VTDYGVVTAGKTWSQMTPGDSYRTVSRTLTEVDLVTFVNWFGFNERLFLEADYAKTEGYAGRLVPGALTFAVAEGLTLQTGLLYGTGLAFMGADLALRGPVYVGDTLTVTIVVDEARPSKNGERGVVTSTNTVRNQHDEIVMVYRPVRLQRGDARISHPIIGEAS
jgi:acyl dehydratase